MRAQSKATSDSFSDNKFYVSFSLIVFTIDQQSCIPFAFTVTVSVVIIHSNDAKPWAYFHIFGFMGDSSGDRLQKVISSVLS